MVGSTRRYKLMEPSLEDSSSDGGGDAAKKGLNTAA